MRILYDHQIFSIQQYGGISRYFHELICGINAKVEGDDEAFLSLLMSNNEYLKNNDSIKYTKMKELKSKKSKTAGCVLNKTHNLLKRLNYVKSVMCLKKGQYDVFHPTYYNNYFLKFLDSRPFVLTVYDMIHEKFPEMFNDTKTIESKRLLINKCSKIIAISANTKKDIVDTYGVDPDKIDVVYLGSSPLIDKTTDKNVTIFPKRYILYVGDRRSYKNFNLFIQSISKLLINDEDLCLVCVGGGAFDRKEKQLLESLNIVKKVIQVSLSEGSLKAVYKNAQAFVFPSLYEGFGLPILEAFSCGCPVILSNSSSFPEVALNAAVYFDPKSSSSILSSVEQVVYDSDLRSKMVKRGYEIVKEFDWSKTVEETLCIYKSVC